MASLSLKGHQGMLRDSIDRYLLVFLTGLFGLLTTAPGARAEDVKVCMIIILATDRDKGVDEELKPLAQEIQKKEPKLKSLRLEDTICKPLTVGKQETYQLIDKEVAGVTVKKAAGKDKRVSLTVKPPRMGEIDYTTCCGKFFPIITPYQNKDKERLIIAIRVQPCPGDKHEK
jgi:hypothetical protein